MNDIDFGWIIGIIEGEGTFVSSGYSRRIIVSSTDKYVVDRLKSLAGGTIYGPRKRIGNRKPLFSWSLADWNTVSFLIEAILPELSPRRQSQAKQVLDNPPLRVSGQARANASSRFRGVSWDCQYQKWRAQINGHYLGRFDSEKEAAKAIINYQEG